MKDLLWTKKRPLEGSVKLLLNTHLELNLCPSDSYQRIAYLKHELIQTTFIGYNKKERIMSSVCM